MEPFVPTIVARSGTSAVSALASEAEAETWIGGSAAAAAIKGDGGDCIVLNAWSADTPEGHRVPEALQMDAEAQAAPAGAGDDDAHQ